MAEPAAPDEEAEPDMLSDGGIRTRMAAGGLILGGDPSRAVASAYGCRPGLIVSTGEIDPGACVRDWTGTTGATDI